MREVRESVKREWQAVVAAHARRRRTRMLAAASIAIVASIMIAIATMNAAPAPQSASVVRIEGHVTSDAGWLHAARALKPNATVHVGDEIATGKGARIALHVEDGLSLRLDQNTLVRFAAPDRLELERGAVYVASEPDAQRSDTFTVATRDASVRHIGTQYEVRTIAQRMQVSVREGRVVIDTDGALHEGKAGERIAIGRDGTVNRTSFAPIDPAWHWVSSIAPPFDIENRSLNDFLAWFTRETGHDIAFASTEAEQAAQATILRGSIEGLEPRAALATVLATTDLDSTDGGDGQIIVRTRN